MSPSKSPSATASPPRFTVVFRLLVGLGVGLLLVLLTVNTVQLNREFERQRQASKEHLFWVVCQPGHSAQERGEAFLGLLALGNTEWRSADLSGLNLPGINLTRAALLDTDFRRSVFSRGRLSGARMAKASLPLVDLTQAVLEGTDLAGADLYRAVLDGAICNRAQLTGAVMQEIQAEKAQFVVADLSEANLLMANLSGANLSGANLSGANLEAARFEGVEWDLARVTGVGIQDADFTDGNWWRARGWSAQDILHLMTAFPPSDAAGEERKADFEAWRREIGALPAATNGGPVSPAEIPAQERKNP